MYIGGMIVYALGVFYLWIYKNMLNIFRSHQKRKYIPYKEVWENKEAQDAVDHMSYELLCKVLGGVITSIIAWLLIYFDI